MKAPLSFRTKRGVLCAKLIKCGVPSTNYAMRVFRNGRRVYFALPTTVSEAGRMADEIDRFLGVRTNSLDDAIRKFAPDRWARMNPVAKPATVGDLLDAHALAESALGIEHETAVCYRQSLLAVYSQGMEKTRGTAPGEATIRALPISTLNVRLVSAFKIARIERAGDDQAEQERKKRSVNGVLRSVRALFSEQAMEHYAHLSIPGEVVELLKRTAYRKIGKVRYRLPAEAVVQRVMREVADLRKYDPVAYLAFLLAAHAGLRAKEILAARHDWLERYGVRGRVWVKPTPDFKPKGKHEGFAEVEPWVLDEIAALAEDPVRIVPGGLDVLRRLNTWLKQRGLKAESRGRAVHELRKLFGSYIATTRGIYVAQTFLRHASADITNDTYADCMLSGGLTDLWKRCPVVA